MRFRGVKVLRVLKLPHLKILYEHDRTLLLKVFSLVSWLNLADVILVALVRQYIVGLFNTVLIMENRIVGYANGMIYFLHVFRREGANRVLGYEAWLLGLRVLLRAL